MERYYIFFRCWEHFAPDFDFPFEKFDDLPDDEIGDAVEAYAKDWHRDHPAELDKRWRDETERKLVELDKRSKQRTAQPGVRYRTRRNEPTQLLEPTQDCSLGCRVAYEAGWLKVMLHRFGDPSPSKRKFFMQVEGYIN